MYGDEKARRVSQVIERAHAEGRGVVHREVLVCSGDVSPPEPQLESERERA